MSPKIGKWDVEHIENTGCDDIPLGAFRKMIIICWDERHIQPRLSTGLIRA